MAKANRFCYTDNKPYYYCPSCPSEGKKESFYNMFCCERCSKIFHILTDETFKHITTEQCKKELLLLGVTTEEAFKENINKHIKKVFDYEVPIELQTTNTIEEKTEEKKINYVPKKRKSKNSEVD
jgi:hypothetical protein